MFRYCLFVFILFISVSCTQKENESELAVFQGRIKSDVKTWDPANAYDEISSHLIANIYETLYQYQYLASSYRLEPLLAAAMPTYSADGKVLTIPIRRGVKFQDDPCFKRTQGKGRELTAQDFVFALKRLALPSLQSSGWWVLDGKVLGANAFHDKLLKAPKAEVQKVFQESVEGIQAIDAFTLQIRLVRKSPDFLYLLAMTLTSPVPWEAVERYADEKGNLSTHPVGTGPFTLTRWDRGHRVLLTRVPNFRKELYPFQSSKVFQERGMGADFGKTLPFLDQILMTVIPEDQPAWLNFMKGKLDMIVLPKDNFRQAIVNQVNLTPELVKKGVHLSIETGNIVRFIAFNMKDPVLGANKYLRQALSSAIDREKWIELFTNNTAKKMVNAVPPGIDDRPATSKLKYDFHLARARTLLERAGYPRGVGLPVLRFDLSGASTTARQLVDFLIQQFAPLGVKIEVIENTFPAYLSKLKNGSLQIFYAGWSLDFPDASNIYQLLYGPNQSPGTGESNYDNPVFDRLFEQIETMPSGPKRSALIQKMEDLIQEDCPWAMGYYEATFVLSQPWFMNYRDSPIITNKYKYFRVNKEVKQRYLSQ